MFDKNEVWHKRPRGMLTMTVSTILGVDECDTLGQDIHECVLSTGIWHAPRGAWKTTARSIQSPSARWLKASFQCSIPCLAEGEHHADTLCLRCGRRRLGPNGLAAAITLARAGCSVLVIEAHETPGGGMRSAALTLPGFVHDVCSAIHPLGVASPFMRTVPLAEHGVTWINPPAAVAHPFDDGTAAVLERSLTLTGETLGLDAAVYERLMAPWCSTGKPWWRSC